MLKLLKKILELFLNPQPTSKLQITTEEKKMSNILYLKRNDYNENGIFGVLTKEDGTQIAVTLEHSYDSKPKLYNGTFQCVRGPHRLHNMTSDFITFEITGVEDHSNILFHWGNYNKDSDGCVLLGKERVNDMITTSRDTFKLFMDLMAGLDSFTLIVS